MVLRELWTKESVTHNVNRDKGLHKQEGKDVLQQQLEGEDNRPIKLKMKMQNKYALWFILYLPQWRSLQALC